MSQEFSNPVVTGTLNFPNAASLSGDVATSTTVFKDTLQTTPQQTQDRNIVFRIKNAVANTNNIELDNFSGVHMPRNVHIGGAVAVAKNIENKGESYDIADFNKGAMKMRFVIDRNTANQAIGNRMRFEVNNDLYPATMPLPITFGGNKQADTMSINTLKNEVVVNGQLNAVNTNTTNINALQHSYHNKTATGVMEGYKMHSNNSTDAVQRLSFDAGKHGQSMELQHSKQGVMMHINPQGMKEDHTVMMMGANQFSLGYKKQGADETLNLDLPAMPPSTTGGAAGARTFQISTGGTPAMIVKPRAGSLDGHEVEVKGKLTAKEFSFTGDLIMDGRKNIHFKDGENATNMGQDASQFRLRSAGGTHLTIGHSDSPRVDLHQTALWLNSDKTSSRLLQRGDELHIQNGNSELIFHKDYAQQWVGGQRRYHADGEKLDLSGTKSAELRAEDGDLRLSGKQTFIDAKDTHVHITAKDSIGLNADGFFHVNVKGGTGLNSRNTFVGGRLVFGGQAAADIADNKDNVSNSNLARAYVNNAPSGIVMGADQTIAFHSKQFPDSTHNRFVVLRTGMMNDQNFKAIGGNFPLARLNANSTDIERSTPKGGQEADSNFGGLQMFVDEDLEFNVIGMHPANERNVSGGAGKANPTAYQIAKFRMDMDAGVAHPTVYMSRMLYGHGGQYSDKRLKQNIEDVSDDHVAKLRQLRAVKYNPKERPNETRFGFIAQEVEEVYPHLVQHDMNGMKTVEYTQLIPILAKANSKLMQELEETKKRVQKLEGNIHF